MRPVNAHDAKTHLSRLLARAEAGQEIVIARAGRPVAKLVPLRRAAPGGGSGCGPARGGSPPTSTRRRKRW